MSFSKSGIWPAPYLAAALEGVRGIGGGALLVVEAARVFAVAGRAELAFPGQGPASEGLRLQKRGHQDKPHENKRRVLERAGLVGAVGEELALGRLVGGCGSVSAGVVVSADECRACTTTTTTKKKKDTCCGLLRVCVVASLVGAAQAKLAQHALFGGERGGGWYRQGVSDYVWETELNSRNAPRVREVALGAKGAVWKPMRGWLRMRG